MPISELKHRMSFPILVLIFLSLIWGSSFILMKKGLLAFTPIQVGGLRIFFASIVLLPIALKADKRLFRKNWKKLLTLGVISNLIPAILFAEAETELSSSLAGMLNALTPAFTVIVGIMFFYARLNFPLAIGLILGLAGSIVISFIGGDGSISSFNYYALYVILATILYGISTNIIKDYVNDFDPVVLISLTMLAVAPISIILLLFTDLPTRIITHEEAWFSLLCIFILGAVGTAFALALFNKVIKNTNAVFASSVTYLIPIVAIGWGLLDDEMLYPLHFVGMALIILGVFLINKYK